MHSFSSYALCLFSVFFAVIFLAMVRPADAHKLNVFAYEENGEIKVEARFSGGRAVKNSPVTVKKQQGQTVLQGKTDEQGNFSFVTPAILKENPTGIIITVSPGDGHKGSWKMEVQDYIPEFVSDNSSLETISPPPVLSESKQEKRYEISEVRLRQIISQELAPVKRALAQEKIKKVTPQDIFAGLGYILGLAGIATLIHYRKTEK